MADEHVTFFGQRMTRDWAEMLQKTQQRVAYVAEGTKYWRIPYGSETFRNPAEAASQPCRHCSTILGKLHEPQCDYEQCPKCNWQRMSCDCVFEDEECSPA
jgi:hypothetical protein